MVNYLSLYTNQSPLLYASFVMKWVTNKSPERPPLLDWIRVRDCAYLIGDKCLLCKLSSDDMVAIQAVYHRARLTQFYRTAESVGCDKTESYKTQVIRAHVLNDLLS